MEELKDGTIKINFKGDFVSVSGDYVAVSIYPQLLEIMDGDGRLAGWTRMEMVMALMQVILDFINAIDNDFENEDEAKNLKERFTYTLCDVLTKNFKSPEKAYNMICDLTGKSYDIGFKGTLYEED